MKRERMIGAVAAVAAALAFLPIIPASSEEKGIILAEPERAQLRDGEAYLFGRWMPAPKGPNPLVPRIDLGTVGAYEALGSWNEFASGRLQSGQLVYLEEWRRDRTIMDLETSIGGQPLSSFARQGNELRFFMRNAEDVWQEVAIGQTTGESRYIRLRMTRDLRSDNMVPVAELVDQYLWRKSDYRYHPDGRLASITVRERETGFEARIQTVGP
ncbi:hypothetical protein [Tabrizicola aquatica]|uniref:hypothetical protein n=1 Tax=Tabrizicola aquatica TaxID=909926 RepID=UPI0011AF7E3C|nr:hypothetical protein [Tabrizicola aquatica]